MNWQASPETDDDLIAARDFIAADNEQSALDFLNAAFESFDRLARFPEIGPRARFKHRSLIGVRFLLCHRPSTAGWFSTDPPAKAWKSSESSTAM